MKKNLLLLAAAAVALTANADYYVIGSNVNGKGWALSAEDARMTETSDGVWEWDGEVLGSGFKFNDGTWDNPEANFGSNAGAKLDMNEPYVYGVGSSTGNISFNGFAEVANPHVVLNLNKGTVTVSGKNEGETEWFFNGDFNEWAFNYKMTEVSKGVYEVKNVTLPAEGEFKVTTTGWGEQYGAGWDGAVIAITDAAKSAVLESANGEGGACPFTLTAGQYTVTWDYNTKTVTFVGGGDTPDVPVTPGTDYSKWYVNVVGPFNDWTDNGVNPNENGVATLENLPIGTSEFKVKVWNGSEDAWYSNGEAITIGVPVVIAGDIPGVNMSIAGATEGQLFTVSFDVENNTLTVNANTAVAEVEVADEAPVYFNLQGVQVAEPANGIFVKVVNGKATKVVVK